MHDILSDQSKFRKVAVSNPFKLSLKYRLKISELLHKLTHKKIMDPPTYNSLYYSGSGLGVMYGVPKIHKTNTPFRPILAA